MPEETIKQQLAATLRLAEETAALRTVIEQSPVVKELQKQNKRLTKSFRWLFIVTVFFFAILGGVVYLALEQRQDAKTSCLNTNEAREANQVLWDLILVRSAATNSDRTPKEKAFAKDFQNWMHELYAPRDCDDLGKTYTIPPPPRIQ